jgi:hypothetical protein
MKDDVLGRMGPMSTDLGTEHISTLDVVMDWLSITKANEGVLVPAVGLGSEDFACAERIRAAHPPRATVTIAVRDGFSQAMDRIVKFTRAMRQAWRGLGRERRLRLRRARRARINRRGWA